MGELWDLLAPVLRAIWRLVTGVLGIMLGFFVLALCGAVWTLATSPRKEREFRRIAATLGMDFVSRMVLPRGLSPILLVQKSRQFGSQIKLGAQIKDVLRSTTGGQEVLLFTYEYEVGFAESAQWSTQTVAAFRVEGRRLPHFTMKPQPFSSLFRPSGSGLVSHTRFSNSYLLQGDDEQAIRSMFEAPVLDFFSREAGWWVEAGDEWLVIYKDGRRVARRRLPEHLRKTREIALLFPNGDAQA